MQLQEFAWMSLPDEEKVDLFFESCDAYYNSEENLLSDFEFDALKDYLLGKGLVTDSVGTSSVNDDTPHKTLMLSLQKVKVFEDSMTKEDVAKVVEWLQKYDKSVSGSSMVRCEWKFDGNAINLIYERGVLKSAVTRGNGVMGRERLNKMKSRLPMTLNNDFTGELRGEVIMKKHTYAKKYLERYENTRAAAYGILASLDENDKRVEDLDVIIFDGRDQFGDIVRFEQFSEMLKLQHLNNLVQNTVVISLDRLGAFYDFVKPERDNFSYPTDGLVISLEGAKDLRHDGKYPYHAISIKFPPKITVTTLNEVQLNLRKSGVFVPKGIIEPVEIDGTTVRRVNLYNWNNIVKQGLYPGAKIIIGKNGDIIPVVQSVVEKGDVTKLIVPENSYVSGAYLMCTDKDAIAPKRLRFIMGCYYIGFKGFGYEFFYQLSSICNYDIVNLWNKDVVNEFTLAKRFSQNKALGFMKHIEGKKELPLLWVIRMLQIPKCGGSHASYIAKVLSGLDADVSGLTREVIDSCLNGEYRKLIDSATERLKEYGINVKLSAEEKKFDITYEMTGTPNVRGFVHKEDVVNFLSNWGHTGLNKNTTYLITNSLSSDTGKMSRARKLGIEILTYEQAIELYKKENQ